MLLSISTHSTTLDFANQVKAKMAIKLFVSSISGSHEVKKQQQHAFFVLSSHHVDLKLIDIADPTYKEEKRTMLEHSKPNDKGQVLPPQIFNEDDYCGDYPQFEKAIEVEELFQFLKLAPPKKQSEPEITKKVNAYSTLM